MVDYVKYCREQADDTFYDPLKESWTMVGDHIERLEEQLHYANGVANLAMKHRDYAEQRVEKLEAALDRYRCNCVNGIDESVREILEGKDE
jgi:hypothetical protein